MEHAPFKFPLWMWWLYWQGVGIVTKVTGRCSIAYERPNVCIFLRTILIWYPINFVLSLIGRTTVWVGIAAAIWYNYRYSSYHVLLGLRESVQFIGAVGAGIIAVVCVVVLIVFAIVKAKDEVVNAYEKR